MEAKETGGNGVSEPMLEKSWRAFALRMIEFALHDATMPDYQSFHNGKWYPRFWHHKRAALWWLLEDEDGFPVWCLAAGLDPEALRAKVGELDLEDPGLRAVLRNKKKRREVEDAA